jgi:hypothetical protein
MISKNLSVKLVVSITASLGFQYVSAQPIKDSQQFLKPPEISENSFFDDFINTLTAPSPFHGAIYGVIGGSLYGKLTAPNGCHPMIETTYIYRYATGGASIFAGLTSFVAFLKSYIANDTPSSDSEEAYLRWKARFEKRNLARTSSTTHSEPPKNPFPTEPSPAIENSPPTTTELVSPEPPPPYPVFTVLCLDKINTQLEEQTEQLIVNAHHLNIINTQLKETAHHIKAINHRIDHLQKNIQRNDKKATRGIAAVAALGNPVFPSVPGKAAVGVGVGSYEGKQALAINVNYRPETVEKISFQAGIGKSNGSGKPVMRMGAIYEF